MAEPLAMPLKPTRVIASVYVEISDDEDELVACAYGADSDQALHRAEVIVAALTADAGEAERSG